MAGWTTLANLLRDEVIQKSEEGSNTEGFTERLSIISKNKESIEKLYDELMDLEIAQSFPYNEPSDLESIKSLRPSKKVNIPSVNEIDFDYFYGAWLGRCCGCALGKPVESHDYMNGKCGNSGWKLVYEWFKGANAYPIKNYVPSTSAAAGQYGIKVICDESLKENIKYMQTDDDIRYTVLGLKLLEEKGLDWDAWDVGKMWHLNLPYQYVCTAETQAYLNFCSVTSHIDSEKPKDIDSIINWVRTYRNPYREWIGAQIRVDGYAYGAAGNTELAAELAWRDASFSHVKNGIYGAMFCSAMIAAAFVEKDNRKIIDAGLAQIPQSSRLYQDIVKAVEITEKAESQLDLVEKIWDAFSHYNAVHTNNNAALCAAAILFAGNDFETAITTAVLGGWDTDCNGATVGSVMGAKLGAKAIPEHWAKPLNDTLYSAIPDFHPISISECARRSYEVYKKMKG